MTLQRSTEHFGVGQSGYTAGRTRPDPSLDLEIQTRHTRFPHGDDALFDHELETEERWVGRGGETTDDDDDATESSLAGSSAPSAE